MVVYCLEVHGQGFCPQNFLFFRPNELTVCRCGQNQEISKSWIKICGQE